MVETKHKPDLSIGCLRLWIHGREFPDDDYWDGNWLEATAECQTATSTVKVTGPFIHLSDLVQLKDCCQKLCADLSGTMQVEFMEPHLGFELVMSTLGQCTVVISMTPDNITEEHRFVCQLDQSYFPAVIAELQQILTTYPFKGV
ncbi:WapI family immunity protein [Simkania sp.]|uniref:WapI family immunity protein n=1 Tax=Simkania sp. TaxID=34094 RepID=UPI003B527C2A